MVEDINDWMAHSAAQLPLERHFLEKMAFSVRKCDEMRQESGT
jgi:hypothetical protein